MWNFRKLLRTAVSNPESAVVALTLIFIALLMVVLSLVSVSDYVDDIDGVISPASLPHTVIAESNLKLAKLHVEMNQEVKKGELLLEFETKDVDADIANIEAHLANLGQKLEMGQRELALSRKKLDINNEIIEKKAALKTIKVNKERVLANAGNQKLISTTQITELSERLLRDVVGRMEDNRLSTVDKLNALSTAHRSLSDAVDAINHTKIKDLGISELEATFDMDIATLKRENVELELEIIAKTDDLASLQTEMEQKQVELTTFLHEKHQRSIRSPIDGMVIALSNKVRSADRVSQGEELLTVHNPDANLEAELVLNDDQYKNIKPGQTVNLELFAWNHYRYGVVKGVIQDISQDKVESVRKLKPEKQFVAKVAITDNEHLDIKMGYTLKARVILEKVSVLEYLLKKLNFWDK